MTRKFAEHAQAHTTLAHARSGQRPLTRANELPPFSRAIWRLLMPSESAALLGMALAIAPGLLSRDSALAQCANVGAENFLCSGAVTSPQVIAADLATVTTAPGFSVNTGIGGTTALDIFGGGPISYIDLNASSLTGGLSVVGTADYSPMQPSSVVIQTGGTITGSIGIIANLTAGASGGSLVAVTGTVTGTVTDGISSGNVDGAGLTVSAAAVNGARSGIVALNGGVNQTRVLASGPVVGTTAYGILAVGGDAVMNTDGTVASVTGSGGQDVYVTASAAVTGGIGGIRTMNYGTGLTTVSAGGQVTGTGPISVGIDAFNAATATGMTVSAAGVAGGFIGIQAVNLGSGATSVTASGPVTALGPASAPVGIYVRSNATLAGLGVATVGLSVDAAAVTGSAHGIDASNLGSGATSIITHGPVIGITGNGISVFNNTAATGLTVQAGAVQGGTTGIDVLNRGSGATLVDASGTVTGTAGRGIFAANGATATSLTVTAADVVGGTGGIYAENQGVGATSVDARGRVTGTGATSSGIEALNTATATALTVTAVNVSGGLFGIRAENQGTGATNVTSTGAATGTGAGSYGIFATNAATAKALTVSAATASGVLGGITADNSGTGATSVTASGAVTATNINSIGINVTSNATLAGLGAATIGLSVDAAAVSAGYNGVRATNNGHGATSIILRGTATAEYGVSAFNDTTATSLTVTTVDVVSRNTGILARNAGSGATTVTANGTVTGTGVGSYGIDASSDATVAGLGLAVNSITVRAQAVSGGFAGVFTETHGAGGTDIETSGLVVGGYAAIVARSAIQPISITTRGLVHNQSRLSTDLAIEADRGGAVTFTNRGGLIGTVKLGAGANSFTNELFWNTAGGVNEFGGAAGTQLVNTFGNMINAASNGAVAETTSFNGLANFTNRGHIVLADGGAGDRATTSGNLRFESGSALAVDINAAGQSDRMIALGAVTLLAGTNLTVAVQDGLRIGTRYTVLTADGGLTGTFSTISGPTSTAFLTLQDNYDANNAYLDVIQYRTFANVALTPNQTATAGGLDTLPAGPLVNAVLGLATDVQARAAFDLLSGELHATIKGVMIDDSRFLREAALDRLRSAFAGVGAVTVPVMAYADGGPLLTPATTDRFAVWGRAFGAWGQRNGNGNAATARHDAGGFFIGADGLVAETWRVGLVGGYSRSNVRVPARASSGGSDNYHVGLYGGTQWGDLALRTGLGYTRHDVTTGRQVTFAGFGETLKGRYNATTMQAFGELGYRIRAGGMAFEPFANLAYVSLRSEAFGETGGTAALASRATTTGVTFTTLGLRGASDVVLGDVTATVRGSLGWRHAFGATTPVSTFAFAGSAAFGISGVPIAPDAAVVEAGLDLKLAPAATLGLTYGGQFAGGAIDQSLKVNLDFRF